MLKFYIVPSNKKDQGFVMSSLLKKEKDQISDLLLTNGYEFEIAMGMFPDDNATIGIIIKTDPENKEEIQDLLDELELLNSVWVGPKNKIITPFGR